MSAVCAEAGVGPSAYRDGLCHNSDREDRYRELLFKHLSDRPPFEVEFFVNPRRFRILQATLGPHLPGARILNVASGPFALEFYVAPDAATTDSLDLDPALPALHADLVAAGLIAPCRFALSDAAAHTAQGDYDVVVINDLFYSKHVDFYAVLDNVLPLLAPGGRIYFDILDGRAGPVWAFFNKDARYRRYDIAAVRQHLAERGLTIEAEVPSVGIKGGLDEAARRLLWSFAGITNNMIFMVCRGNPAAMSAHSHRGAATS